MRCALSTSHSYEGLVTPTFHRMFRQEISSLHHSWNVAFCYSEFLMQVLYTALHRFTHVTTLFDGSQSCDKSSSRRRIGFGSALNRAFYCGRHSHSAFTCVSVSTSVLFPGISSAPAVFADLGRSEPCGYPRKTRMYGLTLSTSIALVFSTELSCMHFTRFI